MASLVLRASGRPGFFPYDTGLFGIGKALKSVSRAVKKTTRSVSRGVKKATRTVSRGIKKYGADALSAAATGASFVPGVGTGIAAGLGTASALARGRSLSSALQRGALSALPGGALTQAGLRSGLAIAQGKRVDRALLAGGRSLASSYGGAAGAAAFDAARDIASGKRVDRALVARGSGLARSQIQAVAGRTLSRLPGGHMPALSQLRPLTDKDPFRRVARGAPKLQVLTHTQRLARGALSRMPTLAALGHKQAAMRAGVPVAAMRSVMRGPAGLPWRSLTARAAYAVRQGAPRTPLGMLSRFETTGISADGLTWTIKSGDTLYGIAQKMVKDGSRWREIVEANPDKPKHPSWGLRLNPGDVIKLPDSWVDKPEAPAAPSPESVSQAAVIQAKATLVAWSKSDGASSPGVTDYGTRVEDASPTWSPRDSFVLTSFSQWSNTRGGSPLETDGVLTTRHCDALRLWAEQRVGTLPAPQPAPPEPEPGEPSRPTLPLPVPIDVPALPIPLPTVPQPPAASNPVEPVPAPALPPVEPDPGVVPPPPSGWTPPPLDLPDYLKTIPTPVTPSPDDLRPEPAAPSPVTPTPTPAGADDDSGLLVLGGLASLLLFV